MIFSSKDTPLPISLAIFVKTVIIINLIFFFWIGNQFSIFNKNNIPITTGVLLDRYGLIVFQKLSNFVRPPDKSAY